MFREISTTITLAILRHPLTTTDNMERMSSFHHCFYVLLCSVVVFVGFKFDSFIVVIFISVTYYLFEAQFQFLVVSV